MLDTDPNQACKGCNYEAEYNEPWEHHTCGKTLSTPNSMPPEGCLCSSFWTVRQKHKPDCPLNTDPNQLLDEILDYHAEYYIGETMKFFQENGESPALSKNNSGDLAAKKAILKHFKSNDEVRAAIDQMEQQGHGGGNWRRLLVQLRDRLGL